MDSSLQRGVITELLKQHHSGDRDAFDQLVSLVYDRLRRIARSQLARGRPSNTVNTTALVHEAYVQLVAETGVDWQNRSHFFAVCARAMRRILVDHARQHGAKKRDSGRQPVSLDGMDVSVESQADLILAVDEALASLESFNERLARVVEYRYFAGLTEEETARMFDTSLRTVQRDWTRARAWLLRELGGVTPSGSAPR